MYKYKIKELRKEKQVTQEELAAAINLSRQQLVKWENTEIGESFNISDEGMNVLANYFKCGVSDLMNNEEKRSESIIEIARKDGKMLKRLNKSSRTVTMKLHNLLRNQDKDKIIELLMQLSLACGYELKSIYSLIECPEVNTKFKDICYALISAMIGSE